MARLSKWKYKDVKHEMINGKLHLTFTFRRWYLWFLFIKYGIEYLCQDQHGDIVKE